MRRCSGLLLTLLVLADHGCLGQVDQGAAQHDDMILVSYAYFELCQSTKSNGRRKDSGQQGGREVHKIGSLGPLTGNIILASNKIVSLIENLAA